MLKFFFFGILVVSLLGTTSTHSQDKIFLASGNGVTDDYKSTLPRITITDRGNAGVVIHYRFKGVVVSPMYVEGAKYYMPHIYGFSHMNEIGNPRLPARNLHVALPFGAKPAIQLIDAKFKEVTKKKLSIHPTLAPHPDCYNCKEPEFTLNQAVYQNDALFPKKPLKVVNCENYMGVTIATIQVRPIQYNPVTGKFRLFSKLEFKVTFKGGERSFGRYSANTEPANRLVKRAVLNRDSIPRGLDRSATRDPGSNDYIIITHSDYLTSAEDLATWKRQLGYKVEVVSQSSWTTTQIDDALKTRYNSWTPKPQYFLLIGNETTVPPEYTSRYTDLYYAEMDGSGFKPEMAYGRIFADNAAEAQLIVDKIINYEKNPPTLAGFYTNVAAAAMYQDTDNYDNYADRRFCHTSEDIRNYLMGQGYSVNRIYATGSGSVDPIYYNNGYYSPSGLEIPTELQRPNFDWNDDASDINNSLNAGRFLLTHRDHGGTTLWGDPEYTTADIGNLGNGELLPVVFSINCLTGKYVTSTECFAEKFLCLSNGGCVGIFAATEISYSGYNDGYACGAIDAIWPDPGIDPQFGSGGSGNPIPAHSAIYAMGDVLNQAKMAMTYLWADHQTTWELHHYYGDPAMQIWTDVPTVTTATHAPSIAPGATTVDITASNCPGGLATLVYEDMIKATATLAGDGTGALTFDALSGNEPNAILTISKHNFKPYVTNLPVEGGVPPVAEFTADQTTVMATGTVQFSDLSTNSPVTWDWTFAGGTPGTGTDQNPAVTYNTPGIYTVSLTVTNSSGSDTETKTDYITVTALQPPVANFTAGSTGISAGESVTFTDTTANNPTSWDWTFAGGTPGTGTDQNPTITYNTPGTYSVTLIAYNGVGSDTETKTDYITVVEKPYCDSQGTNFSMEWIERVVVGDLDNSSGAAGYTDFTSISTNLEAGATVNVSLTPGFSGTVYTEYWKIWIDYNGDHDFEDAGEEVFSGTGSSTVTGNFTVQSGVDIVTRMRVSMDYSGYPTPCETFTYGEVEDYTVDIGTGVVPPPVADFSANTTSITAGDTVDFTDLSTNNPTSWSWTFDGGTPSSSTVQNPSVTYNTAGTYTVELTATNSGGSDTETKVNYITVNIPPPPVADFSAGATTINEGQSVTFTDTSTNGPETWDWTFDGGTPGTSTDQNPTITYNTAGTYTVTLTVSNASGSDTETKIDYITVTSSGFSITNPGFETGDTTGWTVVGDVTITTDSHSGSYAVSLNESGSSVEQVITGLSPNTTYIVSCWGISKSNGEVYFGVKDFGGAEQSVQFTDFKNFVNKSITFTTGAVNTSVTIFTNKLDSKFTGAVDDFQIVLQ